MYVKHVFWKHTFHDFTYIYVCVCVRMCTWPYRRDFWSASTVFKKSVFIKEIRIISTLFHSVLAFYRSVFAYLNTYQETTLRNSFYIFRQQGNLQNF